MEVGLEVGADDVRAEDGGILLECDYKAFAQVMDGLDAAKLRYESAELTWVPDTTIKVVGVQAEKVLRLVERLEDLDDVQKVYANFDIDEQEFERIAKLGP